MKDVDTYVDYFESPLGWVEVCANDEGVSSIYFVDAPRAKPHNSAITDNAVKQLQEYFAGQRQQFSLPLAPRGTAFQRQVWEQLNGIAYGQTCSYGDIAARLQNPKAMRAVGAANGQNPISIVVPCHRVIGSNGKLTGYAGGVERKAWLLAHENPQQSMM